MFVIENRGSAWRLSKDQAQMELNPFISFLVLLILILPCSFAASNKGIPGGWQEADVNDPNVVAAANFAVSEQFSEIDVEYRIIRAMKQVF